MKTLVAIVEEHLAKNAALMNDVQAMIVEAHQNEARMQARLVADPSLSIFVITRKP